MGAVNSALETKWFRHDGLNVVAEFGGQTQATATYLHGIGIDKLISRTSGGTRLYYHTDAIGSVRSLTDQWQNQTAAYSYDAWGRILTASGDDGGSPYRFTSREWEDEIGLQFNRARFYCPEIGRFISPDPLTGGPDDPTISYRNDIYSLFTKVVIEYYASLEPWKKINRYLYVSNNPVNYTDPLGLEEERRQTGNILERAWHSLDALSRRLQGDSFGGAADLRVQFDQHRLVSPEQAEKENRQTEILNRGIDLLIETAAPDIANFNRAVEGAREFVDGAQSGNHNRALKGALAVIAAIEAADALSGDESTPSSGTNGAPEGAQAEEKDEATVSRRSTSEKIRDITENPSNWEKVGERPDSGPRRDGHSIRELWRNRETGETLERHNLVREGKTPRRHPHYKEPEDWKE